MNRIKITAAALVGAVALLAGFGAVSANAAPQKVSTGGTSSVTLPLLGAQLTVDITTGPGGTLSSVSVNPADGLTATKVKPNRVVFVNDAGTAKVSVSGHHGGQRIEARAGSLADISGPGGWSGDVFGDGTTTTVAFTVGDKGDGTPDITGVTSTDATAKIGATQYFSHEQTSAAFVRIEFDKPGLTRSLFIGASLHTDDGGDVRARVGVTLSELRGAAQAAADAAGAKTWTGLLCDGSTATVDYTVNADGTITGVSSPQTTDITTDHDRVSVRFSAHEGISISARLKDGNITVNVREGIRCHDAPPPSVNTPVSTVPDQHHSGDGHDGSGDHSGPGSGPGGNMGGHGGRGH